MLAVVVAGVAFGVTASFTSELWITLSSPFSLVSVVGIYRLLDYLLPTRVFTRFAVLLALL